MSFYQDHVPTPFVTVGNTGSCQPQLQQPTKNHILQDQYITGLENRIRVLWDKYYGDLNYYMERIKMLEGHIEHLESVGDSLFNGVTRIEAEQRWTKAKEAKP